MNIKDIPTQATRDFLNDLADVLEKHGAEINSCTHYVPYTPEHEHNSQVEFQFGKPCVNLEMESSYVYAEDLRDIANRGL